MKDSGRINESGHLEKTKFYLVSNRAKSNFSSLTHFELQGYLFIIQEEKQIFPCLSLFVEFREHFMEFF